VRAFAKETTAQEKYSNAILNSYNVGMHIAWIQAIFMGMTGFLPQAAIAVVLYFGVSFIMSGELTGGLLASFVRFIFILKKGKHFIPFF
jgi:ABC-type bacteriocin/lantibiotic exporter with double-glycine peptidase domain